jgi:hypothetical protein
MKKQKDLVFVRHDALNEEIQEQKPVPKADSSLVIKKVEAPEINPQAQQWF